MPKRVAILQSNYLPWKGYFDLLHDVDELVFLDNVQYTSQDWRNRNRIKTARGVEWISIPVGTDKRRRICDVRLPSDEWAARHWRKLTDAYGRAPFFETYRAQFEDIFLQRRWEFLSDLNQHLTRTIAHDILGMNTRFRDSREFSIEASRQQRLIEILRCTDAAVYVTGPAAKSYLEPDRFAAAGFQVVWKDYSGYPEYAQFHPPFEHAVTVLDLVFHTGPEAPRYIWGWR